MAKKTGKQRPSPVAAADNLPDAELDVLACLWNRSEVTAAEIRQQLAPYRPMAHGSVLTLLDRLSKKGLVTREKSSRGKAYVFRCVYQPAPTRRRIVRRLMDRLFDGNPVALVATLLESCAPDPEALKQIRQLLQEHHRRNRNKAAEP